MKVLKVLGFERYCTAEHSIEENAQAPDVHKEAFIAFVYNDLGCKVSGCAALLLNELPFLDNFGDTKIADFNTFLTIKQDVVKFDVSVDHRAAVDVCKPVCDLFKYEFGI